MSKKCTLLWREAHLKSKSAMSCESLPLYRAQSSCLLKPMCLTTSSRFASCCLSTSLKPCLVPWINSDEFSPHWPRTHMMSRFCSATRCQPNGELLCAVKQLGRRPRTRSCREKNQFSLRCYRCTRRFDTPAGPVYYLDLAGAIGHVGAGTFRAQFICGWCEWQILALN